MSEIWITSDTHFSHANVIDYECRPFKDVGEMNKTLIDNWNQRVRPLDTVYHLGDFGLGKWEELREIVGYLNGNITLVRGNHDDSLGKLLKMGFGSICNELCLYYRHWVFNMTHAPLEDSAYNDANHPFINLHGHIHGKSRVKNNRIHVGIDAWNYYPITIETIISEYKKQEKKHVQN